MLWNIQSHEQTQLCVTATYNIPLPTLKSDQIHVGSNRIPYALTCPHSLIMEQSAITPEKFDLYAHAKEICIIYLWKKN